MADHRTGAVGLLQTVSAVALDDALVAVALADAGHVHAVALGEHVHLHLVAHVHLGGLGQLELLQGLLAGVAGLLQVAQLRLGELALRHVAVAELNGVVAVLLLGLLLHHGAGASLNNGDRDDLAVGVKDLRHADLLADGLFHDSSSLIRLLVEKRGHWLPLVFQLDPSASKARRTAGTQR